MVTRTVSPLEEPSSPLESGIRKRVCKACDRCRLKKSKCDGSSPCSRCKADNAICVFGERKKSHDKIYPKGYVELLESQQLQLVFGLQKLYSWVKAGDRWPGAPLKETNGVPLTHDILERLGALKQESQEDSRFEQDFVALQSRLIANDPSFSQSDLSLDTNPETALSPMLEHAAYYKPAFINPFASQFPPTPLGSPHPSAIKTSSPLKNHMHTSAPQFTQHAPWLVEPSKLDAVNRNMTYEPLPLDTNIHAINQAAQMYLPIYQNPVDAAINPCMTMKDWPEQDVNMYPFLHSSVYA